MNPAVQEEVDKLKAEKDCSSLPGFFFMSEARYRADKEARRERKSELLPNSASVWYNFLNLIQGFIGLILLSSPPFLPPFIPTVFDPGLMLCYVHGADIWS